MEKRNGKDPQEKHEETEKFVHVEKPYDDTRWGYRHQQAIVLFVYVVLAYSGRTCMAVILVAMITKDANSTLLQPNTNFNINGSLLHTFEEAAAGNNFKTDGFFNAMLLTPPYPQVTWGKQQQDFVLASFFWGYAVMQIPGGQLVHRFGTRRVLTVSMIINSVIFLFAPWLAYHGGWIAMVVSRILQGLAQGVMFSGVHAFFGKWTRLEERARLMSYPYSGICLGPLVGSLIGGLTAGSPLGWPGALRMFGVFAAIAAAAVWFCLADTPQLHPQISDAEKDFIYGGLGVPDELKRRPIPWKKILLHPGMMAIIAAHIANAWFLNIIHVDIPRFMDSVLRVDVQTIGILMSVPLLSMFLLSFVFGWISDQLIVRGWLSVVATRKLINGFGMVFSAAGLIAMEFVANDVLTVELILIFIVSTKVASHSGFFVNHVDIAPNYAGVLLSISSFMGNVVAAQTPVVTGAIVRDASRVEEWGILFRLTAGIVLAAAVLYQWLGTADRVAWDQPTISQLAGEEKLMNAEEVAVRSA